MKNNTQSQTSTPVLASYYDVLGASSCANMLLCFRKIVILLLFSNSGGGSTVTLANQQTLVFMGLGGMPTMEKNAPNMVATGNSNLQPSPW